MTKAHSTPLLTAETSNGSAKFWQASVLRSDDDKYYTQSTAWQTKADGSSSTPIVSTPKLILPKNVGRSNETKPFDQAVSEVEANAKRKMDKGYHVDGEAKPEKLPLPMLAHNYEKRSHNVEWPCFLQPKLDGVRMLFDGKKGWSRQGKEFIPEVIQHLLCDLPEGWVLDGELMLPHDQYTFQETMKTIKKYRGDEHPKLEYHVYDLVDDIKTFDERLKDRLILPIHIRLTQPEPLPEAIRWVTTEFADDEAQMHHWHGIWTEQGYEGIMLRNKGGLYKTGHRSTDLQKYKHFIDDEYMIVDVIDGQAKEEGCAIFICETPAGQRFNVRPKGTTADREDMYDNQIDFIGRYLTVKFQNLSDDGIPRFPVGLAVQPDRQSV